MEETNMMGLDRFKSSVTVGPLTLLSDRYFIYGRKVSCSSTGLSKFVRARTTWELDALVESEVVRLRAEEIRKYALAISGNERVAAREMTRIAREALSEYDRIIAGTLMINDRLDWDKQYLSISYQKFSFAESYPQKEQAPEKKGVHKLFGGMQQSQRDEEYESAVAGYKFRKAAALRKFLTSQEKRLKYARTHNAEVKYLKKCFEDGETSAIEKYASIILANSKYPAQLEMDRNLTYNHNKKSLTVHFLFQSASTFPAMNEYVFSTEEQRICEVKLPMTEINELYEKVLLSIGIRTIHELFEAIYTDAVDKVLFNGYVLNGGNISENMNSEIVTNGKMRCVFSMSSTREKFDELNISDDNIEQTLEQLGMVRVKHNFSEVTEFINPITEEE